MAPNVAHAVFTLEDSICHGGHFYSIPMILRSVVGMIHTFVRDDDLTNTNHTPASRMLLRRILYYLHQVFIEKGTIVSGMNVYDSSQQF